MKVTFKYSSGIVSGECIIEDEASLVSLRVDKKEIDHDDMNLNQKADLRFIMHSESVVEISYPIVSTCADEFYRCISAADVQLREHIESTENEIDITTYNDQEKVTL